MQGRERGNPQGIDVSHWQGNIDWQKVKGDGISFAFIKATEGKGYTDPRFYENVRGAQNAGIKIGFYHYATPSTLQDAEEEADWFLSVVGNLKNDLPHAYDLEENKAGLDPAELTAIASRWMGIVYERTGKLPLFYSFPHFIRTAIAPGGLVRYPCICLVPPSRPKI
ncbi:MAG: glycoside hydrolase family 25 protein [Thermicanus sp.]|nr:glycoside hydrolase family 25 protein [Thermicanus sp.]